MDFKGKTVLITGSSRGIGAAIAREFAKLHANIVINYLNSEKEAKDLKCELEENYKVKVLIIKCDVSNELEVNDMIEKTIEVFHSINILVNNAAIAIDCDFNDKTVENFKKILDINLIGTFLVSKYASKYMLEEKDSRIINISSTNGIDTVYPESLDYDASKAGVISLTKNLARQFAPYINVNAVAPGWINTDMNKDLDNNQKEEIKENTLLKRMGEPIEIAHTVVFLASQYADYITGEVIRVDGGEFK